MQGTYHTSTLNVKITWKYICPMSLNINSVLCIHLCAYVSYANTITYIWNIKTNIITKLHPYTITKNALPHPLYKTLQNSIWQNVQTNKRWTTRHRFSSLFIACEPSPTTQLRNPSTRDEHPSSLIFTTSLNKLDKTFLNLIDGGNNRAWWLWFVIVFFGVGENQVVADGRVQSGRCEYERLW